MVIPVVSVIPVDFRGNSGCDFGNSGCDFGNSGCDFGNSGCDFGNSGCDFGNSGRDEAMPRLYNGHNQNNGHNELNRNNKQFAYNGNYPQMYKILNKK